MKSQARTLAKYIAISAAAMESCERVAAAEVDSAAAGVMRLRAGYLRAEVEALTMTDEELASARRADAEATKTLSPKPGCGSVRSCLSVGGTIGLLRTSGSQKPGSVSS